MTLIIDWSALCHNRLYSLLSNDMPITRATEEEEIKYRLARRVYELLDLVKPKRVIFACDNKVEGKRNYWRTGYLELYYRKNTKFFRDTEDRFYVIFDNTLFEYDPETQTLGAKLTKKNTPSDLELVIIDSPADKICPKYKGTRKAAEWVFATPKARMDEIFAETLMELTAVVPDSRIVNAELAEADDIAGVLCGLAKTPHTLATLDSDWYQLISENVKLVNFGSSELCYIEKTPEEVAYDLQLKILQGDAGDGIKGTWIPGKAGCLGAVKAAKIIEEDKIDTVDVGAYERNRKLITLDIDTIPKIVQKNIKEQVKAKVCSDRELSWEYFTINEKEQRLLTRPTESVLTRKIAEVDDTEEEEIELPF